MSFPISSVQAIRPYSTLNQPAFGRHSTSSHPTEEGTEPSKSSFSTFALFSLAALGAVFTASKFKIPQISKLARRGRSLVKLFVRRLYAYLESPQVKAGIDKVSQAINDATSHVKETVTTTEKRTLH